MTSAPEGGVAPASRRVMNLAHILLQNARRLGGETGLAQGARSWTWREINARVDALAAALAARGIAKGSRVLVQARNCHQLFETMFACFRLGAVWVPANFRQAPEEIAYAASFSSAAAMIAGAEFSEHIKAARDAAPDLKYIISINSGDAADYDALVEAHRGQAPAPARVDYDDPCWFFFTSGTTGRPKAAVLTHGQMGFVITNHLANLTPGANHGDASLAVAPLTHGAGIHALMQTARGAKTILLEHPGFDAAEAWRLIERWRVTNMFTVPTILNLLARHPAADRHDHSALKHVIYAGAPMYREDQKFALEKLGPVLVQYFGLGEVTGTITVLPPELHEAEDGPGARAGSCGYERLGMQVSIQDDQGGECAASVQGEICVCGPAVFAGYYNNPEANRQAFRAGWFRTGDLGHLDAEGFLYITGRASDMYISGGTNIYPREIEEKLLQHADIAEAAVAGVPDRQWGESGIAVCVLREGAALYEAALTQWLAPKLARYKLPRRIFFWDALPKSAYGKISKKTIREELARRGLMEG